jgi:ATP/maltotriose-dependent transcriptional regulator MalT
MTMTFSLHENIEFIESARHFDSNPSFTPATRKAKAENIHLFAEKLKAPEFKKNISRPRLNELLAKSANQFRATLICGRAGTGKTALAADFAREYKNVAWLAVDSADADWNTFSSYLTASIFDNSVAHKSILGKETESEASQTRISDFFGKLFAQIEESHNGEPLLIVLDDIHHIFDAEWFDDFFNLLLYSLVPEVHLLFLCRSKPSYPLWRLRSKQVLNVIDEKLLALNVEETEELYKKYGLTIENAKKAHRDCFGRISKLMLSIDSALAK